MRRLAPLVAVLAVQPLAVLLPTMADAFAAAPHPVAPAVTRTALSGVDAAALGAERSAGRALTLGTAGSRVGGTAVAPAGLEVAVLTPRRTTPQFAVAGVTWTGTAPAGTSIAIRVHENGTWGEWTPAPVADDGPDPDSAEGAGGTGGGTDPILTSGRADGVQVKVLSATGTAPAGLGLALVDPGTSAADGTVGTTATASAQAAGTRPTILTRAQWGADESLRRGTLEYNTRVVAGVLHHTAGSNGYSAADVPAQLRGIYAYHTKVRGWNDIAYNVLVDRFGRLWEGRYGGLTKNVRGAHALGFNAETFGVSAMGNYETATPSSAMLTAISRVFAWKFSLNRIDPRGTATLVSAGNLRYPAGARVTVPTMLAHRNVGPTACPGAHLYAKMPALRTMVASRVGAEILRPSVAPRTLVHGTSTPVAVSARLTGTQSWKVAVTSACSTTPVWTRTGTGSTVSARWAGRTTAGAPVPPGTYLVTVTARSATSTSTPYRARVEILPTATSVIGPCPAYRLAARTAASVADGTRRYGGAASTLVVVSSDVGHRREAAFAGALARTYHAELMSSPGAALSAEVVARVRRDNVTRVVLVGRTGTWGAGVGAQVTDLGATPVTIGGATSQDVLVASGNRIGDLLTTAGRPTTDAMLVDPTDPVTAATAAGVAARLGWLVLPAGPTGVPAATSTALSTFAVTDVHLGGTGGIGAAAVTALRGVLEGVVDVRGASRDAALVKLADLVPTASRSTAVVVPGTGTDGLEAVLASYTGRPTVLVKNGVIQAGGRGWLTANGTTVRRIAVAATPGQLSATLLASLNTYVRTASAPAAVIPSSFSLRGAGFGHGVGMSQYGAYALAKGGASSTKILSTYYPGTAVTSVTDTRHVKVNLLHATSRAMFGVTPAPGVTGTVALRLSAGTAKASVAPGATLAAVPAAGGGIEVRRGATKVFATTGAVHVTWTGTPDWAGNGAVARLSGTGTEGAKASRPYRYGEMWVVRVGTRLEVVNELPLGSSYLRGLAEMPTSWGVRGPAALQAQAVAGRTYAWAKLLRGPRATCGGCTVYDSTRDQAFRGYEVELGAYGSYWVKAVTATKGRILTYAGAPAQALYYSSSGGRTQDNRDVFGAAMPYLVSVADPYSLAAGNPMASWRRTVTQASMRTAFGLRDVVSVRVATRTAGRAAKTVTATSSTGATATLTGTQLRSRLRLPSNWVWSVGGA
ncbi:SpoIID/LytB domain-containing protein [Kineosporia sp. R_H_3]|uniref:SpoIID/LytB domain-containing protein n=1 Tax=Kineosporia sp. R_H_3 TaxID=1961848 RepID=UPI001304229F|nr:SpoIID/LytB domain-containing protein [Kineosporia sp. R_H_3]